MEKKFEQNDTVSLNNEGNISKQYLITGFELDLSSLILHIDQAHIEMLNLMGFADVPESMHLLEYVERFIHPEEKERIQKRIAYASERRDDPEYYDRMEVQLLDKAGNVCSCIINTWSLRPGVIKGVGQNITDLKKVKEIITDQTASLNSVIESTDDIIFIVKCSGELVVYNNNFNAMMKDFFNVEIYIGMNILSALPDSISEPWTTLIQNGFLGNKQNSELSILREDTFHFEISANPIIVNEEVKTVSFFIKDVTEKWRMSTWESVENKVFEQLSRNGDMKTVFDILLTGVKRTCPAMHGFVTKKKETEMELVWVSHPSISDNFISKLPLIPIGPLNGSCGLAAYSMQPVYISNIREFECWESYRDITLLQGFQACHSFPILSKDGMVLGTMGAFFKEIHELSDFEISLLKRAVNVSSVILEKYLIENEVYIKSKQLEELGYSIPGVMYIVKMDKEGNRKFDFVSERIGEFMKVSKQTALDSYSSIVSSLTDEDKILFQEKLKISLETKQPLNIEFRLRPEVNPEFHCFNMQSVHRFNEDGTVVTYGSIYDITSQKKVEIELKLQQEEMKSLIKCLDDVVYVLDENDVFLDVFAEDETLLFKERKNIVGKKFADILDPTICDLYLNAKIELLEKQESEKFQYAYVRNGEVVNFCSRLIQVNSSSQIIFTARNFTADLKAIEINKKLNKIIDEASDYARFGSFEYNLKTQEVFFAKSIFDMLGWDQTITPNELFVKCTNEIHPDDSDLYNLKLSEAISNNSSFEVDYRFKHANGQYVWFQSKNKIEKESEGVPFIFQGIKLDITKRKSYELFMQQKNSLHEAISLLSQELFTDSAIISTVEKILPKIGAATEVNRVYIFKNQPVGEDGVLRFTRILEWNDGLFPAQIDNDLMINCSYEEIGLGRWVDVLSKGDSIISSISEFPQAEQEILKAQNVVTMAVVPIFLDNEWRGFLGLDECKGPRKWDSGVVELIESISRLIGLALKRKQEHTSLSENKAKYKAAFETMSEAIIITDREGMHINSNEAAKKLMGFQDGQKVGVCSVLKQNGNMLIHPDGSEFTEDEYPINRVSQKNEIVRNVVMGVKTITNEMNWISVNASPLYDVDSSLTGLMLVISDVGDKIQLAEKLNMSQSQQQKLEEKIPHDIANSLDLVSQMMQLQKQFITDENAQLVLDDSTDRIQTLKQLHLYSTKENGTEVLKTESFFNTTVKKMMEVGNDKGISLNVSLNVSDILLPMNKALPFCLMVNEILSNNIRHAFSGKLTGDISVTFKKQGDYFILEVSDNGRGLPKNFDWEKSNTFGFRLIKKLLIQLKGAATITSDKGCKIMVTFPS
ncbi:MAG: PAS domain S-box protein [Bacteroidia bacterium]